MRRVRRASPARPAGSRLSRRVDRTSGPADTGSAVHSSRRSRPSRG